MIVKKECSINQIVYNHTVYYEGPTAYQGGVYLGGKEQIYIHKPWEINGILDNTTHLGGIK